MHFRNLKVTDPNGQVIWEGLPTLPGKPSDGLTGSGWLLPCSPTMSDWLPRSYVECPLRIPRQVRAGGPVSRCRSTEGGPS